MSVQLPPELREAARLLQARLRGGVTGVKWVAPEQLHLTLYFLGEISLEQTAVLKAIMGRLKNGGPFPLELSGGGAFPSAAKPQVLWAGVKDSSCGLATLHALAGTELRKARFKLEDGKDYRPHITLGRVKRGASAVGFASALAQESGAVSAMSQASRVELVESRLSCDGPQYRVLEQIELRGR